MVGQLSRAAGGGRVPQLVKHKLGKFLFYEVPSYGMGVPQPLVLRQHLGILPSSLVRETLCLALSELVA